MCVDITTRSQTKKPCQEYQLLPEVGLQLHYQPPSLPQPHICIAPCANLPCKRQGHRRCTWKMCKRCCISHSRCNLRDHTFNCLSTRQQEKLTAHVQFPPPHLSEPPFILSTHLPPASATTEASFNDLLMNITANSATTRFLEQEHQRRQSELRKAGEEAAEEELEEQEFQKALAASLGPYTVPDEPQASLPRSFTIAPNSAPSKVVRTVPYQPPIITQHMNEDWMRPTVDHTKKTRQVNRVDLDNHFLLVFWEEVYLNLYLYSFC